MLIKKFLPALFLVLAIIFAFVAYDLSFDRILGPHPTSGAPIAFALLSAACFFCSAYLLKKNSNSKD
jgi:hypothetical protein